MSGGVDSSVAAFLLQKEGFEVIGIHMRLGGFGVNSEDAARQVCRKLGISFYPINLADKFKQEVVDYFLESYKSGITPNPCVKCNKMIKFGELLRVMKELGADHLATGHYLRILECRTQNAELVYKLNKANDTNKDQTYFIYNLTQGQLAHVLFPLGDYTKEEVKKIAVENYLPNIKTESQDICFLNIEGKIVEHNEFLQQHVELAPGKIIWLKKEGMIRKEIEVGQHKGLPLYTIGQRRGIEVGGIGPFYAVCMDYQDNILYVVDDADDELLFSDSFKIENVNWLSGAEPKYPLSCEVMIRYRHKAVKCRVIKNKKEELEVLLEKPERAIMSGQSAVFYNGDELLGGGIIQRFRN